VFTWPTLSVATVVAKLKVSSNLEVRATKLYRDRLCPAGAAGVRLKVRTNNTHEDTEPE